MSDFRYIHLPYALVKQGLGYVVVNRRYKPIGFDTHKHVTYQDYPIVHRFEGLGPKMAARLSHDRAQDLDLIYLYDDACIPTGNPVHMRAYLKRLDLLAKLHIEDRQWARTT